MSLLTTGRKAFATCVSVLLLALAGCDEAARQELSPGDSTRGDVEARMGRPAAEWPQGDGRLVLEYPRGPEGRVTWMVELDENGRYLGMRNVLKEEYFARVRPGMRREDLRPILGRHTLSTRFPTKPDEEVLSWRYEEDGRERLFDVTLGPDGAVLGTTRRDDPRAANSQ